MTVTTNKRKAIYEKKKTNNLTVLFMLHMYKKALKMHKTIYIVTAFHLLLMCTPTNSQLQSPSLIM